MAGKIDFRLGESSNLTIGGTWDYFDRNEFIYTYSMFNADNNPRRIDNTYRGYVKFTQRFGGNSTEQEKSASNFKNFYYTVQADYTSEEIQRFNNRHRENFFNYGYVGKFQTYKVPSYGFGIDTVGGNVLLGFLQNGFRDTLFSFQPGDVNPLTTNYTMVLETVC